MRRLARIIVCTLLASACDDSGGASNGPDRDLPEPDAGVADAGPRPDVATSDAAPPADALPADADVSPPADAGPDVPPPLPDPIRINELQSQNAGTWIDEQGALTDWVELINAGPAPVSLAGYTLADREDERAPLPDDTLLPGEIRVFFADGDPEKGPLHLPFRLSADGETLYLRAPDERLIDEVEFPALAENDSFARVPDAHGGFEACHFATPGRPNGSQCGAPPPPELPEDAVFEPYEWSEPWPFPPRPLVVTEIALRPAAGQPAFVEVLNASDAAVPLDGWSLRLAPVPPGSPWPAREAGTALAWPAAAIAPGERLVVPATVEDLAELAATPRFEGGLSLWKPDLEVPVDRAHFMEWPEGAALTRLPDDSGHATFCAAATPGAPNEPCEPLPARPITDRVHHLRTPGDFARLAEGGVSVGIESVKFIVDMQADDTVHFLDTRHWDLHYTFVRELIDHLPHLNRCDPEESQIFRQGWYAFSEREYFEVETRRYLLGTLVHYAGSDMYTVEFTPGDAISSEQMRRAFFTVMSHVTEPRRYAIRPTEARQYERLRAIEGRVPIVGLNAPFRGVIYQPLTEAVGFGVLSFVSSAELPDAPVGPQDLVVTDEVPNDIQLVAGLITESFQTPLAHVNLLSRNRGTPNMGLRDARNDPRIAPLLGQLVRLEVAAGGFDVRLATPEEAEAFWESRRPSGEPQRARLDTSVRGVQRVAEHGREAIPFLGGKAAQTGELFRVVSDREACPGPLPLMREPFGVPVVHSLEHFAASGADAILARWQADATFRTDPRVRATGLAEVRAAILAHPVEPDLLAEVEGYVREHFGTEPVRFRSSSNTEDLPGFTGAGLYQSFSATLDDPDDSIEDAIRRVWASLWLLRGYDEREYARVDHTSVGMGILGHEAFPEERANGVVVTRNILEPIYPDPYINAQAGEASVTNPAPGVTSDQFIYHNGRPPWTEYFARSSLTAGRPVLSDEEIVSLVCVSRAIHAHFQPLIDPERTDRWFAMDLEYKFLGPERALLIKQARPYSFGNAQVPLDCREF